MTSKREEFKAQLEDMALREEIFNEEPLKAPYQELGTQFKGRSAIAIILALVAAVIITLVLASEWGFGGFIEFINQPILAMSIADIFGFGFRITLAVVVWKLLKFCLICSKNDEDR